MRRWLHFLPLGFVMWSGHPAAAQQIILTTSSAIGGSATQGGGTYNTGQYYAGLVTDQQTGTITVENNATWPATTYWLGSAGNSPVGYFVIDLGSAYALTQISLFNTHNATYNDYATLGFHIDASNSTTFVSSTAGYDLTSATTILTSNLAFANPASETVFTSANGLSSAGAYRYLRFTADSSLSGGAGLNEIRVFAAVPEASTGATFIGISALAYVVRRRRAYVSSPKTALA